MYLQLETPYLARYLRSTIPEIAASTNSADLTFDPRKHQVGPTRPIDNSRGTSRMVTRAPIRLVARRLAIRLDQRAVANLPCDFKALHRFLGGSA
jgi:hypothetical protein